ncbi:unnamed protein product [Lampetra planeri]
MRNAARGGKENESRVRAGVVSKVKGETILAVKRRRRRRAEEAPSSPEIRHAEGLAFNGVGGGVSLGSWHRRPSPLHREARRRSAADSRARSRVALLRRRLAPAPTAAASPSRAALESRICRSRAAVALGTEAKGGRAWTALASRWAAEQA